MGKKKKCVHDWRLIDKVPVLSGDEWEGKFMFYCTKCLKITVKE